MAFESSEAKREVFYVGGEFTSVTVGNTTAQYMLNQIYVEKLTPASLAQSHPIIFIAGGGQTGTNFLTTPDGRPGWADFFLSQGYTVYLTDQASRGRSAWHPSIGTMAPPFSTQDMEKLFTATAEHGLWPQSRLLTQWPGTGKAGDPFFDALYASQVQYQTDRKVAEAQNAKGYAALLDRIGKRAWIVAHSQAGPFAWRISDVRPELVQGIIALEPGGPPFEKKFPYKGQSLQWGITDGEVIYEPPAGPQAEFLETIRIPAKAEGKTECILQKEPAKKLKNLVNIPVILVTSESGYHAPYDYCTVEFLRQAGVSVEHADLGEEGIKGNGHFMFMEKNNIEIAERVHRWMQDH